MINGATPKQTELEAAQQRLAEAVMSLPMNPQGAAISAYVSGTMTTARVSAIENLMVHGFPAKLTSREAMDQAVVKELTDLAQKIEAQVLQQKMAAPRIQRVS